MPFVTLRRAFTMLAVLGTVSACDGPLEVCTLIGCSSGLAVNLSSAPVGAFSVEILPDAPIGNPPTYRVECGGSAPECGAQVFFPDLIIERAQVRIVTTLGTVTHPIGPVQYGTAYPNGRQCSPACRRATVTVGIPE
jgi:hypothetical protein